jgi:hypothetical protein
LAHLAAIEGSPNTVRAYAHGLLLWWEFLTARGVAGSAAGIEDVVEVRALATWSAPEVRRGLRQSLSVLKYPVPSA